MVHLLTISIYEWFLCWLLLKCTQNTLINFWIKSWLNKLVKNDDEDYCIDYCTVVDELINHDEILLNESKVAHILFWKLIILYFWCYHFILIVFKKMNNWMATHFIFKLITFLQRPLHSIRLESNNSICTISWSDLWRVDRTGLCLK